MDCEKNRTNFQNEFKEKSELWVRVENEFGIETYQKVEKNRIDNQVNASAGMPKDRTSLDGMMY